MLKARGAGGSGTHFRGVDAEAQMGEIGLAERHEARVEITPNEKKQEGNGGEILVGDGVDDGEAEVDAKQNFGVGHPAGFVPVFFGDEGVFLSFDFKFGCAGEFGFLADDGFDDGLRVADRNANADGHDEGHVEESAPPGFRANFFLRDEIKAGNGASGGEKERQVDNEHLKPALIEANDHDRKKRDGENDH